MEEPTRGYTFVRKFKERVGHYFTILLIFYIISMQVNLACICSLMILGGSHSLRHLKPSLVSLATSRKGHFMNKALFTSNSQIWETPQDLFDLLDLEFHFNLDPCASHNNAKCNHYYTKEQNGLAFDWSNRRVFCNPPYNEVDLWVSKCYFESRYHKALCVMLIPARTDTKWFHRYIYPYAEIRFLKGRVRFLNSQHQPLSSAPFPSMVVIFRPSFLNYE